MMNIYGNVDLALITEEVVEGVTAGQQHQDILVVDFAKAVSKPRTKRIDVDAQVAASVPNGTTISTAPAPVSEGQVEVILDIEHRPWAYVTQPGAFRRIVMNLVGNALKYTPRGWIKVSLEVRNTGEGGLPATTVRSPEHDVATDMIVLTVSDTGKGISPEYLRTRLFTAFAQEDHLASGTGLGLSLVRSILKMLNGDINISSTPGSGTKVVVTVPMIPQGSSQSGSSSGTPSTGGSGTDKIAGDSLAAIRSFASDKQIAVYGAAHEDRCHVINGLDVTKTFYNKLENYLVQWFNLTVVHWTPDTNSEIIIVDEVDLPSLLAATKHSREMVILVSCHYASRPSLIREYGDQGRVDFVSKPFGPYKLARALCLCLDRIAATKVSGLETIHEPVQPMIPDTLSDAVVERATLSSQGVSVNIMEADGVIGKYDSPNANMAMRRTGVNTPESMSSGDHFSHNSEHNEFPFELTPSSDQVSSPGLASRPALRDRRTMSPTTSEMQSIAEAMKCTTFPMTTAGTQATSGLSGPPFVKTAAATAPIWTPREPRLLLVDDNVINLRLLQTFMKKRKYNDVSSAKDGLEAVQTFESALASSQPPDIIFLDISMPIMDGFEAARRIRALEESHAAEVAVDERPASALIIALTGLASGNDQSEAFLAGVDLYMTKPVSFKEVGRLLDNWMQNGGAGEQGVPRGAVTGRTMAGDQEVGAVGKGDV